MVRYHESLKNVTLPTSTSGGLNPSIKTQRKDAKAKRSNIRRLQYRKAAA